ncbi:alpha/beta fold hydrolase [Nocardia uniformis]|uniref:Alpha/beta fold hydrolase n=2 Tax=Nocardia uniformis TaxID=53432 RepID=A0A849CBU0_9NOCA|nr:alpha/beta fold hydrolase [Nocardia uniformis]
MLMAAALVLVASACGTEVTGEPVAVGPADMESFYGQSVKWGSCAKFSEEELPSDTECAYVLVPVDYANPDGDTAEIAISRIKASGQKIGSLLFNPGGPGVSGLTMNTVGDDTVLAERFDRIGFDPRGIGASTPAITCLTPAEIDAERTEKPEDNDPAGISAQEADNKQYADKCVERTGKDFLAHVGTREVVQDMDIIRAVLGDDKLSYVGYSYGTRLGYSYAEKFPDRVRALVLDGALDPSQDPVRESVLQAASFQQAFDAYATECATRPECPLGTDTSQSVKRFRELVDPLWDTQAETDDPRGLHYGDAITGVQQTLYSNRFWPALTKGLNELREGRGDTLLALADLYQGRRDDGSYDNTSDAFNAIRCVDDPRVDDRAVAAAQDSEYRRVAPFLDDGRGTGAAPLELCATWPVPSTSIPHQISIPDLTEVVVVSTTEDPATPYQAGVDLARQLDASLITFDGPRHTVALSGVSECVDGPVVEYLVNLTPPAAALTC